MSLFDLKNSNKTRWSIYKDIFSSNPIKFPHQNSPIYPKFHPHFAGKSIKLNHSVCRFLFECCFMFLFLLPFFLSLSEHFRFHFHLPLIVWPVRWFSASHGQPVDFPHMKYIYKQCNKYLINQEKERNKSRVRSTRRIRNKWQGTKSHKSFSRRCCRWLFVVKIHKFKSQS